MNDDDNAQFARNADSGLFGPCEVEAKTHVDRDTLQRFDIITREQDSTRSECIRNFIYLMVYGEAEVKRRHNDRLEAIISLGLDKAHNKAD